MNKALAAVDANFGMRNAMHLAGRAVNGVHRAVALAGIAADALFRIDLHKRKLVRVAPNRGDMRFVLHMLHSNTSHSTLHR